MAIITIDPALRGVRGRVGALVFSATASGPFVRAWRMPACRLTPRQAGHRTRFSPWAAAWMDLSAGDRALWVAWAAAPEQEKTSSLGEAYYISGYLWFVAINTQLATILQGPVSEPPTSSTPAPPTAPTITLWWPEASPARSRMEFSSGDFSYGASAIVFAAGNRTLGRTSQTSLFGLTYYVLQPSGYAEAIDVWLDYYFGARAPGQRVWFKIWNQDLDGNRSREPVVVSAIVQAQ